VLVGLPERQNTHSLAVLVLLLATVLALFLLVGLAEYAANVLAVDLDGPVELDPVASKADRLAEFLQQDIRLSCTGR